MKTHANLFLQFQAEPSSERGLLQGISVLELCVLVAVKHVLAVYPDQQAFNFEMAFHEYDKFAVRKAKLFRYDRYAITTSFVLQHCRDLVTSYLATSHLPPCTVNSDL